MHIARAPSTIINKEVPSIINTLEFIKLELCVPVRNASSCGKLRIKKNAENFSHHYIFRNEERCSRLIC